MAKRTPFRRIRALDDNTLNGALVNHTNVLRGLVGSIEVLGRERRLLNIWRAFVTVGLIYALLFSHTPGSVLEWFQ